VIYYYHIWTHNPRFYSLALGDRENSFNTVRLRRLDVVHGARALYQLQERISGNREESLEESQATGRDSLLPYTAITHDSLLPYTAITLDSLLPYTAITLDSTAPAGRERESCRGSHPTFIPRPHGAYPSRRSVQ
jgi:hypothetical protein